MPVVVLVVAAIIELTVLIVVGHAIGVLATIGLLVVASLLGAVLLRREGARTLRAFVEALRTRRLPHRELLDGMLVAVAGALIVVPGFVSDALGLLLLLPPIRELVRRGILRWAARRTGVRFAPDTGVRFAPGVVHPEPGAARFAPGSVVEGEVVDEPAPRSPSGELR